MPKSLMIRISSPNLRGPLERTRTTDRERAAVIDAIAQELKRRETGGELPLSVSHEGVRRIEVDADRGCLIEEPID